MDKKILEEYVDAVELIKETEKDIQRLNQKKRTIIQTNVSGSNPEFPYQPQHFKIAGITMTVRDDTQLRYEERLLEERKAKAEAIKLQVQQFLNTISPRMQRIIRYKIFDGMTWEETAKKLGRKTTGESVRKEFESFIRKK